MDARPNRLWWRESWVLIAPSWVGEILSLQFEYRFDFHSNASREGYESDC
jgi:hypothetical protein